MTIDVGIDISAILEESRSLQQKNSHLQENVIELEEKIVRLEKSKKRCAGKLRKQEESHLDLIDKMEKLERKIGSLEEQIEKKAEQIVQKDKLNAALKEKLAEKIERERADNVCWDDERLILKALHRMGLSIQIGFDDRNPASEVLDIWEDDQGRSFVCRIVDVNGKTWDNMEVSGRTGSMAMLRITHELKKRGVIPNKVTAYAENQSP